jgi:hypothetical protein
VAELIETQEEVLEQEVEQIQETQEVEQPQEEVTQEQEVVEDIPTKYRGKSLDEIIRMHQEAEKLIGRQAQEVGEVRKLADELIKRQLETKQAEVPATKEDEIDFYEDPKKFVSKAVETHPAVQEARNQTLEIKKMQTLNRLKTEFPDFAATVTDPQFVEWIKSSPVRVRLYATAESEMDYDSAAELLNTWNYVKPKPAAPVKQANTQVKQAQQAAVKAATVDVGSSTAAPASSKVYRRADLIRLQLEDPDRYYQLQDEIMAAYAEGRVK